MTATLTVPSLFVPSVLCGLFLNDRPRANGILALPEIALLEYVALAAQHPGVCRGQIA